ncbi:alpha/beta fold hydrolase [Oryzomicrobium sp.]|uniref:alpha/beta hydrolase family protein n=1 Tax=Oryzomicrobium sp. TaxID=1911578 RepID=UPI0025DEF7D1|nr:alpha/beta fold hydrolase [Oryzomicrobium sp.]MCE1244502.1 alpha/beta fold hydrolase [Oryzomicrobium sp.]
MNAPRHAPPPLSSVHPHRIGPAMPPQPLTLTARDGYPLAAHHWRPDGEAQGVVVINPATAVKADYYHRYARYLAKHGLAALTYDYRGIGASRQGSLRRWRHITKLDWGRFDCDAALAWASAAYPDVPVYLVGHSIGGLLLGLAPHAGVVARAFTVGAQYAYWPDYGPGKARMWLRWHLLMPALTALLGYFPARRLGWHEDLPAGAAYEWAFRPATLEAAYRRLRRHDDDPLAHFDAMKGDLLAVSLSDDPFGTPAAIERLLGYYRNSQRHHVHLNPADVGVPGIGHFAWFNDRFRATLWPDSLAWLVEGRLNRTPVAPLAPDDAASGSASHPVPHPARRIA